MKSEIKVPPMGESITEATIGAIFKQSGSGVKPDEELLEIETDKVNQVLYAPQGGALNLTVKTGDVVQIGQSIGWVETDAKAEAPEQPKPSAPSSGSENEKPQERPTEVQAPAPAAKKEETQASQPSVRMPKEEFLADIRKKPAEETPAVPKKTPTATPKIETARQETRKPMTKIRKVIAQRLVESQQNSAMLTTFNECDMSQVISLREKYKETFSKHWDVKLGFMSFFVKAVVSGLKEFPQFNSYIDGEEIVHREYFDIGIAVGSERGLVVPVVRDCERLSFHEIEQAIEKYGQQARGGGLSADDLKGGGFTITNGGVYGSLLSTPIINPPQCGILGLHKIMKRPIAVDDKVVIAPMMYLALSYDHRIVDGREAVLFLVHIKNCIEDPTRLLLEI